MNPAIRRKILLRIAMLSSDDQARWGKMTVHQMICHLNDGYRAVLANQTLAPVDMGIPRPLLKWIALRVPVRWPKGVPAPREIRQDIGGTPPVEFEHDAAFTGGILPASTTGDPAASAVRKDGRPRLDAMGVPPRGSSPETVWAVDAGSGSDWDGSSTNHPLRMRWK